MNKVPLLSQTAFGIMKMQINILQNYILFLKKEHNKVLKNMEFIMNGKIFLFSAFCFILSTLSFSPLHAQPGWIQNYQPFYTPYYEYSYKAGNIHVMDDGSFVVNGTCTENDEWYYWYSKFGYLIKFDPEGNILWAKKDSLSSSPDIWDCESETFAILPDGGFVSAGCVGLINPDYLLFRDSDGNLENIIYYNDMNYNSMCVVDNGTSLLFAGANSGAILQKTDLEGNEIWQENYASTTASCPVSVIQSNDGGYAFLSYQFANPDDYCLVKTDSSGSVEWYNTYDYNGQREVPNSLIQTSDGGYLLCGYTENSDRGGFIVKTDSVGDTLWTRKYERSYCARVWCATTFNNEIVLHGYSNNGIIILFKIDNYGNEVWYKEISVIGYTTAEQNMQLCDDGFIMYLEGDIIDDDIVLIKTDENGNVAIDEEIIQPINTMLCYPNPLHAHMTISYSTKIPSTISIYIYNIRGQKVGTLIDNEQRYIGNYITSWNGTDSCGNKLCTGTYFIRLQTKDNSITKKIILIK